MAAAMLAVESAACVPELSALPLRRRWPLCRRAGHCIRGRQRESPMSPETALPHVDVHGPVALALAAGRPVVALESTIITHGMPYPENSWMAANVEAIIQAEGATPATIAVVDGRIKIGLSEEGRSALARADNPMKLSRADLAFAVARRPHRRHDGCRDHDRGAHGGHFGLRHRRHRRRAHGRRIELRHIGRSRRTGAHAGHRGFGRAQGDPRHRKDAGSA